ncbi:PREDICTED: uncharacterized protein LOC109483957 [Branchiostoma belcheri]|uniref:Uncharacterized protein LOC109483957 n=1 Tax=Branchiostoma belcheri TaxID=7741 RepID=A0A6P5AKW4_BRABE|nr:PREDICTED: uncharacterized protein LOC109483957 [Branchiostoma belcheri]XP_019642666.1 PREDICTED: uncharacterized protein LOC109483957 [Branchiostoma belcheri]
MGKDKRDVERGRCMKCKCGEYIAHTSPGNQSCGYCECGPMQHEELSSSPTTAQAFHHWRKVPDHTGQTSNPGQLQDNCMTQTKQSYNERGPTALKHRVEEKGNDPNHLGIERLAGGRGSGYYGKAEDTFSSQQTCSEHFEEVEPDLYSKRGSPNSDSGHGTSIEPSTPSAANTRFQEGLYSSAQFQKQNLVPAYGINTTDSDSGQNGEVLNLKKQDMQLRIRESHVHQLGQEQPQSSTTYMNQQRYTQRQAVIQQHSDSTERQGSSYIVHQQRYGGKSPAMEQHHIANQQYGGRVSHKTDNERGSGSLPLLQERLGQQEESMHTKNVPDRSFTPDPLGSNKQHSALPTQKQHGERSDGTENCHDLILPNGRHVLQTGENSNQIPAKQLRNEAVGSMEQNDIQNQIHDSPSTHQEPVQQREPTAVSAQYDDSSHSYSHSSSHTPSEKDEDIMSKMKHLHLKLQKLEEEQESVKRELKNILSGVNLPVSEIEIKASMVLPVQANRSDNLVQSLPTWKQHMIPGCSVQDKNLMEAKFTLPPWQNPLNQGIDVSREEQSGSGRANRPLETSEQSLQPMPKPLVNYDSEPDENSQSDVLDIHGQESRERGTSFSQGSVGVESSEQSIQLVAKLDSNKSGNDGNKRSPPRQSSLDQRADISEEQHVLKCKGDSSESEHSARLNRTPIKVNFASSAKQLPQDASGEALMADGPNLGSTPCHSSGKHTRQVNKLEDTYFQNDTIDCSLHDNDKLMETESSAELKEEANLTGGQQADTNTRSAQFPNPEQSPQLTPKPNCVSDRSNDPNHIKESTPGSEMSKKQDEPVPSPEGSRKEDEPVSSPEVSSTQNTPVSSPEVSKMHDEPRSSPEASRKQDEPDSSPEVSRKQDDPVSSSEVSKKQDEPVSSSEMSRKQDEPASRPEVSRKQDEPVSSPEVSKKQDEPASRPEMSRKQDEPVSSPEVSKKQDEPVSSPEVSKKQDEPVSRPEMSRKQDEPVSSPEVSKKQDEPASRPEMSRKQDEPVSSPEVSKKQDEPASRPEMSRKQDEPDSSPEVSRKQDEPVSSPEVSKKQDEPASRPEMSRKQDEPVSSPEVSKKQDEPVSSPEVSKKQDEPVSSPEMSKKQDEPVASPEVSKKQDEPVSSPEVSKKQDVPVSSSELLRKQDKPFSSPEMSRKQDEPVSSSEVSRKQDESASRPEVSRKQDEAVSSSSTLLPKDKTFLVRPQKHEVPVVNSKTLKQGVPAFNPGAVNIQSDYSRSNTRLKWRDQHGTFHPTVHGKNIKIESNGATARRDQCYTDGICFSQLAIKMGCNIHLKIVESRRFRGSMRIGFTSKCPEDMSAESLPAHSYPEVPEGFWIKPLHDNLAQQGYVVTYMVDSSGDVFYSINGEEKGLFFSGVDVSHDLWAAVDIHGSTIAVQFANDQVVADAIEKNIHEGDQVVLQVESVETLQLLQEGHGGMHHDLEKAIGDTSTGVAIRIDDDEDVRVYYKKHNRVWCINPAALRKVGKVDTSVIIMEGDLVLIGRDEDKIKALQKDHGEWVETMGRTLGKVGRVTKITHQGDLRLRVDEKTWTYNAEAVKKITMKKGTTRHSGNCDKGLHYWKRGVAKVCTGCGECTANGTECHLQGSPFRSRGSPCGCREKTGGCADCGLCHACAGETEEETDNRGSKKSRLLRMLKKYGLAQRGHDSDDEEAQAIAVGDKVRVTADAQTLPILQREGGIEWHEDMLQVRGMDGKVTTASAKSVTVHFPNHGRWSFVPGCLTKVRVKPKGEETYQKGELVRIMKDGRQLKRIQGSHDGYSRDMEAAVGKTGCVMKCKDRSVKVDVTGISWWFHPSALSRAVLKEREPLEVLHIRDGDIVKVDVDAETFKTNQVCHGGYVDRMEKSVEDFGVVHHLDIDGDAVVYYPDGTRWCINAMSLGKVDPAECGQIDVSCVLEVADWVKVEADKDKIKRVQERTDSIKWQEGYYKTAGKVGQVRTTYPFNDVITVQIEGSGYPLNPKLLRRASPADLKEVFGSGDIKNPGFTRGDLVKIAVDMNRLRILQDGHGGFVDKMEELLELVGCVSFIDRDGDVYVRFSIRRLCFNPFSLTKITPEEDTFQVGDLLMIESDRKRFQELQRPAKHGRYNHKMLSACGKVGRLQNVISHDRVRVKVLGRTWVLNPQLVTRTGNPGLGTGDWKSATICAPNKHDWSTGRCLVCVKCGECTHYGRLCPAREKPGRYPGSLCGCGNGHAGCDDCGTCRGCAGEIQIHEDIESNGKDGWQGDAMEKLGGEHQPTSSEKTAAHKVISAVLKKMSQAIDLMKKSGDEQSTDAANMKTVLENDFLLPFTKYASSTHKKLMGDHLANINAAPVLLDQYLKCVPAEDIQGRDDLRNSQFDHECLQLLRELLIHCTNGSFEFCRTVGRCNLLATLLQDLSTFHRRKQNDTTWPAIHSLVTILSNCARVPENQEYFSSCNVVSILTPYLRSKDEGVRITTLSCLAFIVEEDNLHFIRLNVDMTELIVSLLRDALDNPDHVTTRGGFQYPALQVTTIISVLVRNEQNKLILVKNGVLDLLIKQVEMGDGGEKESALLCIRKLADSKLTSGIIKRETKVKKLLLSMTGDRKLSKPVRDAVAMTVDVLEHGPPQETKEPTPGQGNISTIKCTDLLVDTKTPLGGGGFGLVFRGYHRRWMMNVAVKRLLPLPRDQKLSVTKALIEEANFMRCAQNAYRFIVPLYGVCVEEELTALVMDFMENGSVSDLMSRVKHVPWALRWRIIHETILGMNFLHSMDPQIIHHDLKSQNILLDQDFHAKISDFGLSKYKNLASKSYGSKECLAGTMTHIPPENFINVHLKPGEKFDVYSFGILIWEILTGQTPYGNAFNTAHIRSSVTDGQRPDRKAIPKEGPNELPFFIQLMEECWHQLPRERPQFRELGERVQGVMQRTNVQVAEAVYTVRTALGKEERDPIETQPLAAGGGPDAK